jgi:prepilin-type N-terminal cleavage/methylation domain-containing protein
MIRCRKSGFTLVELLVVITIIGMLMALLLPAVQAAREHGRRTQCINNQKEVGTGAVSFEAARGSLPGFTSKIATPAGKSVDAGWAVALLPFLDRRDLADRWKANPTPGKTKTDFNVPLRVMYCPSDPPDALGQNDGPCSYVINMLVCPAEKGLSLTDIRDGTGVTLLFTERFCKGHNWWDTNNTFTNGGFGSVQSNHGGGVVAAFCDRHVSFLNQSIGDEVFNSLATPTGGEPLGESGF